LNFNFVRNLQRTNCTFNQNTKTKILWLTKGARTLLFRTTVGFQLRFRGKRSKAETRKRRMDWEQLSDDYLKVYYEKPKLSGYDFYKSLGSPKHLIAPMVDQSELAFRMLCKRYNAHLAYTPMFHSQVFLRDIHYRYDYFHTCPDELPLLIQLCGNDAQVVLECAKCCLKFASKQGNAHVIAGVDLNLGCPQRIAKRGFYGAYLMDDLNKIREIINLLHRELPVPVTCKIRIFPDIEKTIEYVDMLVEAGAQMITIHGRTRDQRGHNQGLADWDVIKTIRERHRDIPIFANGNIRYYEDVVRCMEYTGVDGVMSACGLLNNPALFANQDNKDKFEIAYEYLECAEKYPVPNIAHVKAHLFDFIGKYLTYPYNADLRKRMSGNKCRTPGDYRLLLEEIQSRYEKYGEDMVLTINQNNADEKEEEEEDDSSDFDNFEDVNLFELNNSD
jgi:tRNA-dihydrouridine synthase 1